MGPTQNWPQTAHLANPMFCIGNPIFANRGSIRAPPVRETLLPKVSTPAKLFTFFLLNISYELGVREGFLFPWEVWSATLGKRVKNAGHHHHQLLLHLFYVPDPF